MFNNPIHDGSSFASHYRRVSHAKPENPITFVCSMFLSGLKQTRKYRLLIVVTERYLSTYSQMFTRRSLKTPKYVIAFIYPTEEQF